jgi:hypothetical protein
MFDRMKKRGVNMHTHMKYPGIGNSNVSKIFIVILLTAALLLDPAGLFSGMHSIYDHGLSAGYPDGDADVSGGDSVQTAADMNENMVTVVEENGEYTYLSLDGAGCEREILEHSLSISVDSYKSILQTVGTTMYNSNAEALNTVFYYNEVIEQSAEKYGVDKALIQSILFQELRFINVLDEVDTFVQTTFYCLHQSEDVSPDGNWTEDLISDSVLSTIHITDSSTGLGQIYAKTAIKALNWYNGVDVYDYDNWRDIESVWVKLKYDNEYNIDMIGLILSYNRHLLEEELAQQDPGYGDILRLYNGYGDLAEKYEEVTYEYYLAFNLYNQAKQSAITFQPV